MKVFVRRALMALAVLLGLAVLNAALQDGPPGEGFLDKWSYNVVLVGGSLALLARGFAKTRERVAWILLGLGSLIWTAGNVYYTTALWDLDVIPVPSFADYCWIAFYLFVYVGLIRLVRSHAREISAAMWIDGVIAALNVGCLAAVVVFEPVLADAQGSAAMVATNLAYPVGDVILIAFVAGVAAMSGWRIGRTWLLILAGLATFFVADSFYLVQTASGSWVPGNIIEAGWPLAFLFLGVAAWRPPEEQPQITAEGLGLLVVPSLLSLIGLAVLIYDQFVSVSNFALALSFGAIVAIILRMAVAVHENISMFQLSRNDAVTDALTGLGNRRRLLERLEEICSSPEQPTVALVLFDLNGFKGYNDSFGHPAGDVLLARLGALLRREAAVVGGAAYRLGGDEFCVLLPARDTLEDAVRRLSGSLTEEGRGFSIAASLGVVLIPDEAPDPSEALRLADRRLYADKRRDRVTPGEQMRDVLMQAMDESHPELVDHHHEVSSLASEVGRRLGLADDDLSDISLAAQLHDIGKVAIPDSILRKPGPLDDEEWVFMRRHTIIGERILAAAPSLISIAPLVRASHERFDGTGYPDGLEGEEIPLGARIIFACDAWDAMTSERPYSEAFTERKAVAELRRNKGTQFDPDVVDVLMELIREGFLKEQGVLSTKL